MNLSEDDWLFPSTDPAVPLRYEDVLARKIQPKAKELGLPHVTWRNLRKWGATQLVAKRVSVKAAQERLGALASRDHFEALCATPRRKRP